MLSGKNKTLAFFISLGLSVVSWVIIILNVILRVTTLFQYGIYSIDAFSFTFVTILLSIYTLLILFKFSNNAYFPILLILLHMASLRGSTMVILFIVADLLMLLLLNTGPNIQTNHNGTQRNYYYSVFSNFGHSAQEDNKTNTYQQSSSNRNLNASDVIDVEFTTKD